MMSHSGGVRSLDQTDAAADLGSVLSSTSNSNVGTSNVSSSVASPVSVLAARSTPPVEQVSVSASTIQKNDRSPSPPPRHVDAAEAENGQRTPSPPPQQRASSPPPRPVDMSGVAEKLAEPHRMALNSREKLIVLVEEQRKIESSRLMLRPYDI